MLYNLLICLLFLAQTTTQLVSGTVIFVQPNKSSVWTQGETYDIEVKATDQDKDQTWKVSLMVLGDIKCDGICLQDGPVSEIATAYDASKTLSFKVPTTIVQYGKGFFIQLSKDGLPPIHESEKFTINRAGTSKGPSDSTQESDSDADQQRQEIQKRSTEQTQQQDAGHSENSAPSALPALLVTTCSCIFALCLI